jgi:FixJ family two-component response regulator
MSPAPTVFVVDDDDALRDSVRVLLESAGLKSEGFASAREFLDAWRDAPGCVLLDVRMPGMSGLKLQDELAERAWRTPVVFVTGHGDVPMAVETLKKGAFDFLQKPYRDSELLECVRRALAADAERRRHDANFEALTPREREVLDLILVGRTTRAIAAALGVSEKTVEFHRAGIMRKLNVRTREQLFDACQPRGSPQ